MFVIVKIQDIIKIAPSAFDVDYSKALIEEIDRKYSNRVIADVGLGITVYDFDHIGDAFIHPSDGTSHTDVIFRLVAFRPFVGEVMVGKIVSCTPEHVRISTEFSQDIIIPSYALQQPATFDTKERLWVWKYSEENDFYLDLQQPVRFRITHMKYTQVKKSAKGMQATTTEGTDVNSKMKNDSAERRRRRSSSVDLMDTDPTPSALQLTASMNEDGLGLLSWWES